MDATRSYQEICIALRYGVLVQRKATMRYSAEVTTYRTKPDKSGPLIIPTIDAATTWRAARQAALYEAERRFGPGGFLSDLVLREAETDGGLFLASIGQYELNGCNAVNVGCAISIRIRPVE
jgi:hypothetical protein